MTSSISTKSPSIPWLNKDSRTYLERGYLAPGVSPEQRMRQIAEHAEKTLAVPGFADRFETYLHRGWYSLSSPIWSNFGTGRGLSISCVTGEMWVNTRFGGKLAKDIVVGDELLTHRGRFRRVTDLLITPDRGDIYELKISTRMTPIRLTGNHKVLTNLGWVPVNKLDVTRHLVAVNREISELVEKAHVIDMTPFCAFPYQISIEGLIQRAMTAKNQLRTGRVASENYASVRAFVPMDADLAWAIGLWFAEGSITRQGTPRKPSGIRITLNMSERAHAERWLTIIQRTFNVYGAIGEGHCERPNAPISKISRWLNVTVNSCVLGRLFASFGAGCKEKTFPDWVMTLPRSLLAHVLEGIVLGDGSVRANFGTTKLTLANPRLLLQVYQLGLRLDCEMSLQMQDKPSPYGKTKHVYTIIFRKSSLDRQRHSGRSAIPFSDGLSYSPIQSLRPLNLTTTVYDFTVEEDHSFSVAGVILHNCNGSYVGDSVNDILAKQAEVGAMTKHGAGTSAYFGAIRPRGAAIGTGGKTHGSVHFMKLFEVVTEIISQSNVRRGSFAAYLPVDHPDILEFLQIREEGNAIQHLSIGVTIPDQWMKDVVAGDKEKRKIWGKIIQKRFESGYPYLFFSDTVNRNAPQVYRDKGIRIHASNLCSEICLSSSESESFVCDLSSMNLLYYDDWKDTDAVETLTYFLDAILTDYIATIKDIPFMQAAYNFAVNQRALGIGVLGWHSHLQSKMIPFESTEAKLLNTQIHRLIRDKTKAATREMAVLYGEPPLLKGYGERNVTTMAIAPTTSSSFILGQVSPSIEPLDSNYFSKDLAKGRFTYRNPYLEKILEVHDKNTKVTWDSILLKGGSVQHLVFLTDNERAVFKTFDEISQMEIVIQAAARQKFIDQSQSLNLRVHPKTPPKDVSKLLLEAWTLGVKSLYYQRSTSPSQELGRNLLACSSCEG